MGKGNKRKSMDRSPQQTSNSKKQVKTVAADIHVESISENLTGEALDSISTELKDGSVLDLLKEILGNFKKEIIEVIDNKFKEMETNINKSLEDVTENIKELDEKHSTEIKRLHESNDNLRQRISELELRMKNEHVSSAKLADKLENLENRSRRSNLIFDNITENSDVTCKTEIYNVLSSLMGIENAQNILLGRCHRLGTRINSDTKPRPIIVFFDNYTDRTIVWENRSKLKGSKIIIREDFSEETVKKRNILYPYFIGAKKAGMRATIVVDKLLVDGKLFSVHELDALPQQLRPHNLYTRSNEHVVTFFSKNSVFSNMHESSFMVEGIRYSSVEQFLASFKCKLANDEVLNKLVMLESNPLVNKAQVKHVKLTRDQLVSLEEKVYTGIKCKFEQNPGMKCTLLATGERILAECNPHDTHWGTGTKLFDISSMDSNTWSGKNILGKMLMKVRGELSATS